jgi:outer membrane protein assembly factor BamB
MVISRKINPIVIILAISIIIGILAIAWALKENWQPNQEAVAFNNVNYKDYPGTPLQNKVLYVLEPLIVNPSIANGILFGVFSDRINDNRWFCAVDLVNGKEKWRYQLAEFPYSAAPLISDSAVVLLHDKSVIAFDKEDGQIIWRVEGLDISPWSNVATALYNGNFYLHLQTGQVLCIDLLNGKVLNTFKLSGGKSIDSVIAGEKLFVMSESGIKAYNFPSCELDWTVRETVTEFPYSKWIYVFEDSLFYKNELGLNCVSCKTGNKKWAVPLTESEYHFYFIGANKGKVFIGFSNGVIHGYDIKDGKKTWEMALPSDETYCFQGSICLPDQLYISTNVRSDSENARSGFHEENQLWAIELNSCKIIWEIDNCFLIDTYEHISIVYVASRSAVIGPTSSFDKSILDCYPENFSYLETCYLMGSQYWPDLRRALENILGKYPLNTEYRIWIEGSYESYKAVPYLLDMLGVIYRSEGNIDGAVNCFQKMISEYHDEEYVSVSGKGEKYHCYAYQTGYIRQIETLRDYSQDYEKALQLTHVFLKDMGFITEDVLNQIRLTLNAMDASLPCWQSEYDKLLNNIQEPGSQAEVLLDLAVSMLSRRDAVGYAQDVLEKIQTDYWDATIETENGIWSPALSAYLLFTAIAMNQNMNDTEIEARYIDMTNMFDYLAMKWQSNLGFGPYWYWNRCPQEIRMIVHDIQQELLTVVTY